MFTTVDAALREDPVDGLPRAALVQRVEALAEHEAAVAAYKTRLIRAIDELDDSGLDGRGVLLPPRPVEVRNLSGGTNSTPTQLP